MPRELKNRRTFRSPVHRSRIRHAKNRACESNLAAPAPCAQV